MAAAGRAGAQSTPPPPPPPAQPSPTLLLATATPSAAPSPTPAPRRRGRHGGGDTAPSASSAPAAAPTSTPTSPAFATLDGTWEVQLQYIDHTDYSYLVIKQSDTALTGAWRLNGKDYPYTGTYDGRLFSLVIAGPKGNVTMAGYVEAAQDMVGTVDLGDGKPDKTPFTAEHRASSKGSFFKDSAPERPHTPGGY